MMMGSYVAFCCPPHPRHSNDTIPLSRFPPIKHGGDYNVSTISSICLHTHVSFNNDSSQELCGQEITPMCDGRPSQARQENLFTSSGCTHLGCYQPWRQLAAFTPPLFNASSYTSFFYKFCIVLTNSHND